ncbi:hypothetical protein DWU98_20500 [Dyella monticola]|uniref:Uncharacterized protein n=1 Tax=Dyella monticola TaxID=1927958 RepID=A0A370WS16_9GAMM|nr:hypothetical protein DWU98_20500 [Dyella monticola]
MHRPFHITLGLFGPGLSLFVPRESAAVRFRTAARGSNAGALCRALHARAGAWWPPMCAGDADVMPRLALPFFISIRSAWMECRAERGATPFRSMPARFGFSYAARRDRHSTSISHVKKQGPLP